MSVARGRRHREEERAATTRDAAYRQREERDIKRELKRLREQKERDAETRKIERERDEKVERKREERRRRDDNAIGERTDIASADKAHDQVLDLRRDDAPRSRAPSRG